MLGERLDHARMERREVAGYFDAADRDAPGNGRIRIDVVEGALHVPEGAHGPVAAGDQELDRRRIGCSDGVPDRGTGAGIDMYRRPRLRPRDQPRPKPARAVHRVDADERVDGHSRRPAVHSPEAASEPSGATTSIASRAGAKRSLRQWSSIMGRETSSNPTSTRSLAA